MPGVQLLIPLVESFRFRNSGEDSNELEPPQDTNLITSPLARSTSHRPSNPLPSVKRGWFGTIVAFILQYDRPPEFHPRYRWLPIASGLLIPFAILLEIPGLTEHWYVRVNKQTHEIHEYRPNSKILKLGLGISMTCAVVANLSLLSRFLERHVRVTTVLAMIFLTIHDMINIAAIVIFGLFGRHDDGFTYAQAYWSTVSSTTISTLTNVTLVIDYVRTDRFANSGSGLTHKQRSLVIIVMMLLIWIAIGAGVFAMLLGVPFQQGLYFTIVSIETIGFGDVYPEHNTKTRIFTFFYLITAILNLALAVATIREIISESFRHSGRKRRKRVIRNKALRGGNAVANEIAGSGSGELSRVGEGPDGPAIRTRRESRRQMQAAITKVLFLPITIVRQIFRRRTDEDHTHDLHEELLHHAEKEEDLHLLLPHASHPDLDPDFRDELKATEKSDSLRQLGVAGGAFIVFWLLGSLIFSHTEKWDYGTAVYFCFIAWSTVGYGDLVLRSPAGRAIFILWALIGVGSLTILISVISEAYAGAFGAVLEKGTFDNFIYLKVKSRSERRAEERALEARLAATRAQMDSLAADLIVHARTYHPHMRHVLGLDKRHRDLAPSKALKDLLITEMLEEDEATQEIILSHPEMRQTLYVMSYDRSFNRLMQAAMALTKDSAGAGSTTTSETAAGPPGLSRTNSDTSEPSTVDTISSTSLAPRSPDIERGLL